MQQSEKIMVSNFQKIIRTIHFHAFFFSIKKAKNSLFQIGKDFAYLAVTMVPERKSERDCGHADK